MDSLTAYEDPLETELEIELQQGMVWERAAPNCSMLRCWVPLRNSI